MSDLTSETCFDLSDDLDMSSHGIVDQALDSETLEDASSEKVTTVFDSKKRRWLNFEKYFEKILIELNYNDYEDLKRDIRLLRLLRMYNGNSQKAENELKALLAPCQGHDMENVYEKTLGNDLSIDTND